MHPRADPLQELLKRRALDCSRPEPAELGWLTWQGDCQPPRERQHDSRSSAGEAERSGAGGHRRLLAYTVGEVGVGAREPIRDASRNTLDLPLEIGVDHERATGDLGEHLDRTVVVCRTQSPR